MTATIRLTGRLTIRFQKNATVKFKLLGYVELELDNRVKVLKQITRQIVNEVLEPKDEMPTENSLFREPAIKKTLLDTSESDDYIVLEMKHYKKAELKTFKLKYGKRKNSLFWEALTNYQRELSKQIPVYLYIDKIERIHKKFL